MCAIRTRGVFGNHRGGAGEELATPRALYVPAESSGFARWPPDHPQQLPRVARGPGDPPRSQRHVGRNCREPHAPARRREDPSRVAGPHASGGIAASRREDEVVLRESSHALSTAQVDRRRSLPCEPPAANCAMKRHVAEEVCAAFNLGHISILSSIKWRSFHHRQHLRTGFDPPAGKSADRGGGR